MFKEDLFGIKACLNDLSKTHGHFEVIHKAAFCKNVTPDVGNYHLKDSPVIAITNSLH